MWRGHAGLELEKPQATFEDRIADIAGLERKRQRRCTCQLVADDASAEFHAEIRELRCNSFVFASVR
jgi:hypothetical protein